MFNISVLIPLFHLSHRIPSYLFSLSALLNTPQSLLYNTSASLHITILPLPQRNLPEIKSVHCKRAALHLNDAQIVLSLDLFP
jgi:hypothetical protein